MAELRLVRRKELLVISEAVMPDCFKTSWSSGRAHWRHFVESSTSYAFVAMSLWSFDLSLKSKRTGKEVR